MSQIAIAATESDSKPSNTRSGDRGPGKRDKRCEAPDCRKMAPNGRYCSGHRTRVMRHGTPGTEPLRSWGPHGVQIPIPPLREYLRKHGLSLAACWGRNHSFTRYATRASVSEWIADEMACSIGRHPTEIWGDDWWRLTDPDV
jgi:hypothetical protein